MKNAVRIFYSYSHKDEQFREALETHLAILKRQDIAIDWHDRKIIPGQEWASEIDAHLNESDVIILLISADFIASNYCYGKEMDLALSKHESGSAFVLPIIVRPVDWMTAPFAKLQALPRNGKPVTTWTNQDEAWLDIAKGVRKTIDHILKNKMENSAPPIFEDNLLFPGLPTGFYALDQAIDCIHTQDILLIAGRPSMGKSNLTLNIAAYLTIEKKVPVAFFSLRLLQEHITRRLLSLESIVPIHRLLRGFLGDSEWPKLTSAAAKLHEAPLFLYESPNCTDVELDHHIERLKKEAGIGLVIIDGIEYLISDLKHTTRNAEVTALVKSIRCIGRDHKVPIILTGSVSREVEMRRNKRPIIRDLDEWDLLASDTANVVIFLYRSEVYDKSEDNPEQGITELIIAKNDYGPTTTLKLAHLEKYCSFKNLTGDDDDMQG
jgi:replicative DNA helicase